MSFGSIYLLPSFLTNFKTIFRSVTEILRCNTFRAKNMPKMIYFPQTGVFLEKSNSGSTNSHPSL